MSAAAKPDVTRHSPRDGKARGELGPEIGPGPPRVVELLGDRRVEVDLGASVDGRIRTVAECQRGRASREQLLAAGITASAITRRVASGRLERVHRSVYGLPNTADLPLAAETAALLACGPAAVLSHHSAAVLWELRPGVARPVHVTLVGERGCPDAAGVKLHRSRTLAPADLCVHQGLPVTSPVRTLLDVAATLTDRDVERLLDEALFVRRILRIAQLDDLVARVGGHPGRARLARAAANHARSTKTDSPPEEKLLTLIRAAGLPEPRTQFPVLDYCLDFVWPELRLAVEVDAYGTHGSRTRFESDRRRDARLLTEKGIVVIRLTQVMIEERPFEAVGVVARAIGQREAEARARAIGQGDAELRAAS